MSVKVRNNNVNAALKVFKRVYSDKIYDFKEKQYFEKPSRKKHKAKLAAKGRERKRIAEQNKLRTRCRVHERI
jgi:ribosomal protein S21